MPIPSSTDQERSVYRSRFHQIKRIIQEACCNEIGDLRTRYDNDAEPFVNSQEKDEFFSKYASLLLEYERLSSDEEGRNLIEEEKNDIEYRILTASGHLESLGASVETITDTAISLRQDLEKRMRDSVAHDEEINQDLHWFKGKKQIKQISIEARNMILCDVRIIYLDLSPLKKNLQIAHSMSYALSSIGLFPDNPETIREILGRDCTGVSSL